MKWEIKLKFTDEFGEWKKHWDSDKNSIEYVTDFFKRKLK